VRIDIRRIQSIKMGSEIIGNRVRVRIVKNKVAPPFRTTEFDIMYNEGISRVGDLIDLGTQYDVITKRGAYYSYGDIRLGQGRENTKEFLRQNPDITEEIEENVRTMAMSDLALEFGVDDDEEYEDDEDYEETDDD